MRKRPDATVLFFLVAACLLCHGSVAQLSISVANTAVTQNFDGLANTGADLDPTASMFSNGWSFLEAGTSNNNNQKYSAGTGSSNVGDTYSFGVAGTNAVTDRTFGMLQSGTLTSILGFKFTNNTGQTLASLTVGYTGEVWGLSTAADKFSFSYQIGNVALNAATGWNTVAGLAFTTPITGSGAVDGNNNANRTVLSPVTITGLYIPTGTTVTFRWVDGSGPNSSAMGIDDFTITAIPASNNYFRTRASGSWNDPAIWEKSTDNATWSASSNSVPTNLAAGVTVTSGNIVTADADLTISKLVVEANATLQYTSGTLTVTDSPGDDVLLEGANSVFDVASAVNPVLNGSANSRIGSGAVLLLSGNNNLLAYHGNAYSYANGAVFEYSHSGAPDVSGTFFGSQDAAAIPVFRYSSANTTALGGSSATTINGKVEVSAGRTLNLAGVTGTLTLRNGLTGTGDLKATTAIVTGTTAELGGSGAVNSNLTIEAGCTATLTSDKPVTSSKAVTINGTLDFGTQQLSSTTGAASFVVNSTGLVKTANASGLVSAVGSLKTGAFSVNFASGSTVMYNATGSQTITVAGVPAYQNLQIAGSGIKTAQGSANLIVQGSCTIQSGSTLALTGLAAENLYLNNSASLQIMSGSTFDNGGESAITSSSGTPSVIISGTFITRDQQGFTGTNTSLPSITPTLNSGCTVEYGRSGDQAVQANITYENLVFSGSGTRTPTSAVSLNATVFISGSVVLDGSTHTIGGALNNLTMSGTSRFVVGGTGTRPAIGGTYTLSPTTTIEFSNSNTTTEMIRQGGPAIQYANVEISGSNVATPLTGITLQSGATLTVKNGGVLKTISTNGLYASSNAAILSTNNPIINLQTGSTIEYSASANQSITTGYAYSNLTLSGSGVKTAPGSFTIGQTFSLSGSASLSGTSPAYLANATLAYVDATAGRVYTTGLEWPSTAAPTNLTVNLIGSGVPALILSNTQTIGGALNLIAGTLDLNGKTLTVAGNISGTGTLTGSNASSLALNGGVSTLRFSQVADNVSNALNNLTVNNGAITLATKLNVYNTLDVAGGSLNLNGQSLVLKSDAAQTARVAEIKGVLSGETAVTVERYIPAYGSRRYRLVTAPLNGLSINEAWQDGMVYNGTNFVKTGTTTVVTPINGQGTLITGQQMGTAANANANGFDFWPDIWNSSGSVRYYIPSATPSGGIWQPISNTLSTNAFNSPAAYLLFVRGDHGYSTGVPGSTTLRPKGLLNKGSFSVSVPVNMTHTVLGNPYASPIDFYTLYNSGINSQAIRDLFWIWKASLGTTTGGFVLVQPTGSGNYEYVPNDDPMNNPPSVQNRIIHSGEGFLVEPKNFNAAGSTINNLTIQESHKSSGTPTPGVLRQMNVAPAKLYVNTYTEWNRVNTLLDGVLAQYDPSFALDGSESVNKNYNTSENLSIQRAGKDLTVFADKLPQVNDTVQLRLWNTAAKTYELTLTSKDFGARAPGLSAVLVDRYLQKETAIDLMDAKTTYPFSVTAEESSKDPLRFFVLFRPAQSPLPLLITELKAYQKGGGVEVAWKVENETGIKTYEVERAANGIIFERFATVSAKAGAGQQTYGQFDASPEKVNYYRIKMLAVTGEVKYSGIVKVELDEAAGVKVYPNPAQRRGSLQIQLIRQPAGMYRLRLYSSTGQLVLQRTLFHQGSTSAEAVMPRNALASGQYKLEIQGPGGKAHTLNLQVVN